MLLDAIAKELELQKFDCTRMQANENIPLERLIVSLGPDAKKRERLMEISLFQVQISDTLPDKKTLKLPTRAQFQVILPFKIESIALSQVASLLLFLNPYLELPGFDLNELKGFVAFRYVWLLNEATYDSTLLGNIVGSIILALSLFSDMIELLADGQMTFNDLLAQVLEATTQSP